MHNKYIICFFLAFSFIVGSPALSRAEVYGPKVKIRSNTILVSTGMNLDEKTITEISKGVSREIVFYIDLFRQWRGWPDEFVLGVSVSQTLRCDPVKNEFTAVSSRRDKEVTKRFESCDQLISWTMSLPDEKLSNLGGLVSGAKYYVVTSVEGKILRTPSFLKKVLFFVPDTEFEASARSDLFTFGEDK